MPPRISGFLSRYLLMALGLKGGFALAQTGFAAEVLVSLDAPLAMAILMMVLAASASYIAVPAVIRHATGRMHRGSRHR